LRRTQLAQTIHQLIKDTGFMSPADLSSTTAQPQVVVDDTQRNELRTLVARLNTIINEPNGKTTLATYWLRSGIPFTPKELSRQVDQALHPSNTESLDGLELAQKAIERTEADLHLAFNPPPAPPAPRKQKTFKKPAQLKAVDEGVNVDPKTIALVKRWVEAQSEPMKNRITEIARQANLAGNSISLIAKPSERRFEIARSFTFLETVDPDDFLSVMHALLDHIGHRHEGEHVGTRLAHVGLDTARQLSSAAQQFADGNLVIHIEDDGTFTIHNNTKATQ
jgi:hypothetical protein